jgi:intracellular septation protein A
MKDVFAKLATDFFSTIVFLALYLITGNVVLATSVAIAGAVAQVVYSHVKGQPLSFMTYASLALVIVLGSATLLTNDPRFVLAKPSIAHFAIGAIMLKRGWMLRYMPPIVAETIPEYVTLAGYAWAALMFALGAGVIAVASTGDIKLWAFYVSVVAIGQRSRPSPCNMSRFASSSPTGFVPPAPDRKAFSSEVGTGSREENASKQTGRGREDWACASRWAIPPPEPP